MHLKYRVAWMAALLIVGALYFWVIGIGAEPRRFAWNSDLDRLYGLPSPAAYSRSICHTTFSPNRSPATRSARLTGRKT